MKKLLYLAILFSCTLSAQNENGYLQLGVGYSPINKNIDDQSSLNLFADAAFRNFGALMDNEIRFGENYITEYRALNSGFPGRAMAIDTRWVIYKTWAFVDIGPFAGINSTSFKFDGATTGLFVRLKVRPQKRTGLYVKFIIPGLTYQRDPRSGQHDWILFNNYKRDLRLRDTQYGISVGGFISLSEGWK